MVYIEGHKGIVGFSNEVISLKVKKGVIVVNGKNLVLDLMTENTVCIKGEITSTEVF